MTLSFVFREKKHRIHVQVIRDVPVFAFVDFEAIEANNVIYHLEHHF